MMNLDPLRVQVAIAYLPFFFDDRVLSFTVVLG